MRTVPVPVRQYPTVRQYMSPSPWTIARTQPLGAAQRLMRERGIRYLPVVDGDRVIGTVSERDISLLESFPGVDPTNLRVEEAMASDPYKVSPDAPLAEVVTTLLERRLGSAIVLEADRVTGVFTTHDALRALADLLEKP